MKSGPAWASGPRIRLPTPPGHDGKCCACTPWYLDEVQHQVDMRLWMETKLQLMQRQLVAPINGVSPESFEVVEAANRGLTAAYESQQRVLAQLQQRLAETHAQHQAEVARRTGGHACST